VFEYRVLRIFGPKWDKVTRVWRKYIMSLMIWIFRKWDVGVWTGSSWLRIGTVGRRV
jgi:hypothetical protein